MDTSGLVTNVLQTLIGGVVVAWLFAPTDVAGLALHRLRIMGSFLYRTLGLLAGCTMLVTSAYETYRFAYSEAPITRMEVIGLVFYMLNFFVYLMATIAVIAIWSREAPISPRQNP